MTQFNLLQIKDLGLQREVMDALPYAVVGETWAGTFSSLSEYDQIILSNYIVPSGQQLKLLYLRTWTQETSGAIFGIEQTNPSATGNTGDVEAYPVVGSVPSGYRDYPMLEAAGDETLGGHLREPIHVLEGSIDFLLFNIEKGPLGSDTNAWYGLAWWGVVKIPEQS